MRVELRYAPWRLDCPRCGVTTELVPWAQSDSGFTHDFEQTVALLGQRGDQTTVSQLMGIAWRTVGRIVERVVDRLGPKDLLDGLTKIGIDEISYRKHHRYLTIVTDHERGHVVWAAEGKSGDTVREFFARIGPDRAAKIEIVSLDMSAAYIEAVTEQAPNAEIVYDRFHVQRLVQDALDEVRRGQARELQGTEEAKYIKHTRWTLQKRWDLDAEDARRLSDLQRRNKPLYRAYLLKESFCAILGRGQVNVAGEFLDGWLKWAKRSRLAPFRKVARTIEKYKVGILNYVRTGLSNGRVEGLNNKIRTITKRAYGFHSAESLIAYIYLCCTGLEIPVVRRMPLRVR